MDIGHSRAEVMSLVGPSNALGVSAFEMEELKKAVQDPSLPHYKYCNNNNEGIPEKELPQVERKLGRSGSNSSEDTSESSDQIENKLPFIDPATLPKVR
jgi:hypothetical protein